LNLKNCRGRARVLNCNTLNGWNIYSVWMMQETPRKYKKNRLKPKRLKGRPSAKWKDDVKNDIRKMGIVSWRQERNGWRRANRKEVILLG
jgi:hypothetical protein